MHKLSYNSNINLELPKPSPIYRTSRSYKYYQPKRFENELAQIPWQDILWVDDVNEKVAQFNLNFLDVLEKHAPCKTRKIKYCSTPFIDQRLNELMFKRDKIHKVAQQTGAQSNWNQYRIMCDDVNMLIKTFTVGKKSKQ
jgi:hypothetical protein